MEDTDHDIRTLVEMSAKNDVESCKKLYELLVDKVHTYVSSRTTTHAHATDVTQDVFIDFFSTLSKFSYQSRAQFYAYVFVITRRKLARHYEQMKKTGNETMEFDERTMSPITNISSSELRTDVAQALQNLAEGTREIVVLHHWSGYTFGEIALFLDMTESAVRVRHHRALTQLSKYLKK